MIINRFVMGWRPSMWNVWIGHSASHIRDSNFSASESRVTSTADVMHSSITPIPSSSQVHRSTSHSPPFKLN
ncbi:hypothetical protein M378DRAFT_951932 [Amanita muscaria Koide BX008]|uniref:Uncharacterized protein n=1 Tax=Amanita muscaria (strain Koide BX008) TaxID=946122 RepID=A0A0C2T1B2_AMAMK|nr:hypothetical protein M378DRAFT_951932 [Amanita muscaria Koide BX008]